MLRNDDLFVAIVQFLFYLGVINLYFEQLSVCEIFRWYTRSL